MTNEKTEFDKLDLNSTNIAEEKHKELLRLFPEIRTEGGKIDFEKLKLTLGEILEVGKERYGMNWPGKIQCMSTIQSVTNSTLRPIEEKSFKYDDASSVIIEGDNLEVLKILQKSYLNKFKVIYIDPPYNTGNDFIYPDNFSESLKTYLQYTNQIDSEGKKFGTNMETDGRFHSNWMNMMYPRLYLSRNLLRDDGALFVSIDEHELIGLRSILNEIYGEENHVATLTIINNLKGRNDKANVATCHEYLVIYSKTEKFQSYGLPLTEEQLAEYKYTDENGKRFALRDLRKRGRPDRREDRPNMYFPIFYNQLTKKCSLSKTSDTDIEIVPKRGDNSDGRWRWGKDRVNLNLENLHPRFSEKKNRWDVDHRVYLDLVQENDSDEEVDDDDNTYNRTSKSKSFWMGGDISTDVANREFKKIVPELNPDYPKSPYFLERILQMTTRENDAVLDFFAGTGTTAQAVMSLNFQDGGQRSFVLVQLPQLCPPDSEAYKAGFKTIVDITRERVLRYAKTTESKIGIKYFQLSESNFIVWNQNSPNEDLAKQLELHVDHVKNERTADDILYEILLKSGFPLTTKVETQKYGKQIVYSIAGGMLLVCLEDNLTLELIKYIAEQKPERVICLDQGFANNDQLKANAVQIFRTKGIAKFQTV